MASQQDIYQQSALTGLSAKSAVTGITPAVAIMLFFLGSTLNASRVFGRPFAHRLVMHSGVFTTEKDLKIRRTVIRLVVVHMVDDFIVSKRPTDLLFSYETVLKHVTVDIRRMRRYIDLNVSFAVGYTSASPFVMVAGAIERFMAGTRAKDMHSALVRAKEHELFAALFADEMSFSREVVTDATAKAGLLAWRSIESLRTLFTNLFHIYHKFTNINVRSQPI